MKRKSGRRGTGGLRRRRRNHRADSACLCFHFPPKDRRSRGRLREEWEKRRQRRKIIRYVCKTFLTHPARRKQSQRSLKHSNSEFPVVKSSLGSINLLHDLVFEQTSTYLRLSDHSSCAKPSHSVCTLLLPRSHVHTPYRHRSTGAQWRAAAEPCRETGGYQRKPCESA